VHDYIGAFIQHKCQKIVEFFLVLTMLTKQKATFLEESKAIGTSQANDFENPDHAYLL